MARTEIVRTCFRSGDEEHEIPERNAWRAVAKCDSYSAQPNWSFEWTLKK